MMLSEFQKYGCILSGFDSHLSTMIVFADVAALVFTVLPRLALLIIAAAGLTLLQGQLLSLLTLPLRSKTKTLSGKVLFSPCAFATLIT